MFYSPIKSDMYENTNKKKKTFNQTRQINTRIIRTGYQSLSFAREKKTASKSLIFNIPSSSDASDVPNLDISFIVLCYRQAARHN